MGERPNPLGEDGRAGRRGLPLPFWGVWAASVTSGFGDGLSIVALPLLAASLTRQPLAVAAVLFLSRLPWLVVAIPAGVWADRADRIRLMRTMDLIRAALFALVVAAIVATSVKLWLLYVVALGIGTCETVFSGASQAILPAVVSPDDLVRANSLMYVGGGLSKQSLGPAVGGVLFSVARFVPLAGDAVSFLGSAGFLAWSRAANGEAVTGDGRGSTARDMWAEMVAGLAWYRGNPALRWVTATVAVLAFCQAMISGILVLFALERLKLGGAGYGLLMGVAALGNVVGGLVAPRVARTFTTARVLTAAAVLAAGGYLGMAATTSPVAVAGLLAVEGIAVVAGNVATISWRQALVPAPLQARVANIWRSVIWGVVPLGALLGGVIADQLGLVSSFVISGALQLGAAVLTAWPLHRLVRAS